MYKWNTETTAFTGGNKRFWYVYECVTCGGVMLTVAPNSVSDVRQFWPSLATVSDAVPDRARQYLTQALGSLHAPAGALMLTASSLDAMFKAKGYAAGSLYTRIDAAAKDHLITQEMAAWAHEIRLDANDQRHSDEDAVLPDQSDAHKVIEFTLALAEFLFVLPARVARGRTTKP